MLTYIADYFLMYLVNGPMQDPASDLTQSALIPEEMYLTRLFGTYRLHSGIFILIASFPALLGYNVLSDLRLIRGMDVLDSEDFIVSNLLLPVGSLIYLLFCVSKWGWGFDNYLAEANTGTGLKISPKLKPVFQYVIPIMIVVILLQGL